jgi:hypothetical protein
MVYTQSQRLLLFIQTTATLGIHDRVNEALGITAELEITSQVTDFFNQILSFLGYGGSSVVKTLDQTSFHMQRMVGVVVVVSASVGWFPVVFGGQCSVSSLMTRTSRKAITLSDSVSMVNWKDGL